MGNRFVSFVRANARSGYRVESALKRAGPPFPFSLFVAGTFPFSLVRVQCVLVSSTISNELQLFVISSSVL